MAHVKHGNLPLDARLIIARHTAEKEANARGRDLFHVVFACHVDKSKKHSFCWAIVSEGWIYGVVYLHAPTKYDSMNGSLYTFGRWFKELDAEEAQAWLTSRPEQ